MNVSAMPSPQLRRPDRLVFTVRSTYLPIAVGALIGAVDWHWEVVKAISDSGSACALGGAVASVGATLLGFMLAAMAVLASINQTHLVAMMRKYGHYDDLLGTLFMGCVLMLACTISGFVVLFGMTLSVHVIAVILGLHVAALFSLLDVGRKFRLMLSNLRSE